jgi:hypothetical protein
MGASFAGISGGLFAGFQGFISPESFHLFESIIVLCMIVLGGMGNIAGVILGAVLLTVFPEALRYVGVLQDYLFGRILVDAADLRMLLFGLALVLIMIFRPAGLLPSVRRRQEFGSDASVLAQEQASASAAYSSISAVWRRCRTYRCISAPARFTDSSGRTAPARRPCSTSSPGCTAPTPATSACVATSFPGASRIRWRGSVWCARSRTYACSPT